MLNLLQLSIRAGSSSASPPPVGGMIDALLAAHRGLGGLDAGTLTRTLSDLDAARPGFGRAVGDAVQARLTAVERGELARVPGTGSPDRLGVGDLDAALQAGGGGGRSPAELRAVATAFRRELDGNRDALANGGATMSPAVRAARTELQHTGELALLSVDVYNDRSVPALLPRGFTALSDVQAQSRFPGFTARDDRSGFYSRVYYDANTSTHVVVNRGTDDASAPVGIMRGTPDGGTNWALLNGGRTRQADLAIRNAAAAVQATDGRVTFSGHSLGGALASLQGAAERKPAVVFNPLGLQTSTFEQYDIPHDRHDTHVQAYVVLGDPVARVNGALGREQATRTTILPSRELVWSTNDGLRSSAGSEDPHSMIAVVAGVLRRANEAVRSAR